MPLSHPMAVITANRPAGTVEFVRFGEIVCGTMKEAGHPGYNDFAHVGGLCLIVGFRDVAVDRIPHLRVHRAGIRFPAALAHLGLRERGDRWHLPASSLGLLPVARMACNPVRAALDRPERPPRPGEDIALHERDD